MRPEPPNVIAVEAEVERDPILQKWADREGCALLAFVAPYIGVRANPVSEVYASIGPQEEFGVESFISKCAEAKVKKLHMLVNSPGGGVVSSYKIAKALRTHFTSIRVFVPHIAASGGTLISLTGDEIVMGIMSNLSPLDPQVRYNGMVISSNVFMRCFERFKKSFAQLQPDEAPYPVRCMTDKLDPLIMEEMNGTTQTCLTYVAEILEDVGYEWDEAFKKAAYLTANFTDHSTVLGRERLKEKGFKIVHETKYPSEWADMRRWLKKYIATPEGIHHMRYCLPTPKAAKPKTKESAKPRPTRASAAPKVLKRIGAPPPGANGRSPQKKESSNGTS